MRRASCLVEFRWLVMAWVVLLCGGGAGAAQWPELREWQAQGGGENDAAVLAVAEKYAFVPGVPGALSNGEAWFFTAGGLRGGFDGRWLLMEAREGSRVHRARTRVRVGGGGGAGCWAAVRRRGGLWAGGVMTPADAGGRPAHERAAPRTERTGASVQGAARGLHNGRESERVGGDVVLSLREGRRRSPWGRGRSFPRSGGWWHRRRVGRRWRQLGLRRGRGSSNR